MKNPKHKRKGLGKENSWQWKATRRFGKFKSYFINYSTEREVRQDGKCNKIHKIYSDVYDQVMMDVAATTMEELKRMEEEAGMFGSISDEAIQSGERQTYTSSKLLQ